MKAEFGFTNVSENSNVQIAVVDLGQTTNYACTEDEAEKVSLTNLTCPIDQPEILVFTCQDIPKVNTSIKTQYPSAVADGVQYAAKLEEVLTITDEADPTYRVDLPVVAQLSIRHSKNGKVTDEHIQTVIERLIGALYNSEGDCRLSSIMRHSLRP